MGQFLAPDSETDIMGERYFMMNVDTYVAKSLLVSFNNIRLAINYCKYEIFNEKSPFDDHSPPEFGKILPFSIDVAQWLAGRGRISIFEISCP